MGEEFLVWVVVVGEVLHRAWAQVVEDLKEKLAPAVEGA